MLCSSFFALLGHTSHTARIEIGTQRVKKHLVEVASFFYFVSRLSRLKGLTLNGATTKKNVRD